VGLESGCSNALIDPEETCDDGNPFAGDGCSADCASNELCRKGQVDLTARGRSRR
jgi:cysteine-rich repeat protein